MNIFFIHIIVFDNVNSKLFFFLNKAIILAENSVSNTVKIVVFTA